MEASAADTSKMPACMPSPFLPSEAAASQSTIAATSDKGDLADLSFKGSRSGLDLLASEYASWLKIGILHSISQSSLDLGWSK